MTQNSDHQDIPHYRDVAVPRGKAGIEAYSIWFTQQDKETQQRLILEGLGPETREGDGNYTFEVKPDHKAFAYQEELLADDPPQGGQRSYSEEEVQEVVRRVVMAMQLSESPEVLFQARCILIAFGIGDPPTETELARQRDCSRQFVSKKVKRIQALFNLSPSQFMRSEAACKAYADAWQRNQSKRPTKPRRKPTPHPHPPMGLGASQPLQTSKQTRPSIPPTPHPRGKESINSKGGNPGS
jgi:hypothetical protein